MVESKHVAERSRAEYRDDTAKCERELTGAPDLARQRHCRELMGAQDALVAITRYSQAEVEAKAKCREQLQGAREALDELRLLALDAVVVALEALRLALPGPRLLGVVRVLALEPALELAAALPLRHATDGVHQAAVAPARRYLAMPQPMSNL